MNRRQVLLKLLTTVPSVTVGGVTLAEAVTNHISRHWLDSVSSEDIEAALRSISDDTWPRFRRELSRLRRRSRAAKKRERRADNTVIWRGIVTDDMPPEVLARLNTVPSARRDVGITSANIRRFTDLPEGTAIECFTDSDSWPIPVKDGKPVFGRWRAKHRVRRIY